MRTAKDTWPLDTVTKIVTHLRDKVRRGSKSAAENRLVEAKAKALEQRTAREAGLLAPVTEWRDAMSLVVGRIVAGLVQLPPRFTRDIGERRRLETEINQLRTDAADWMESEAAGLEEAARKAARRRS